MPDIELWFILAVLSAVIGGFGTFGNKIAAARKYNSALIMTSSSLLAVLVLLPIAVWFEEYTMLTSELLLIAFGSGVISSLSSVIKIQVLHYIDSAIFLPLFKVAGPIIVVCLGLLFFDESFTSIEWIGIIVSLLVPLMLISRVEQSRQNNLSLGLILILVAAVISAIGAVLQKYATELAEIPLLIATLMTFGVFVGAGIQYCVLQKNQIISTGIQHLTWGVVHVILLRALLANSSMVLMIMAFSQGGPLGIVYTINSLYIIPPIILAIIFYGEHWNLRKALAITLSILALALLQ